MRDSFSPGLWSGAGPQPRRLFTVTPLFAVTGRPTAGEAHIRLAVAKFRQIANRVKKLLACAIPALLDWNPTWPILDASTCPTCASDGPRRFILRGDATPLRGRSVALPTSARRRYHENDAAFFMIETARCFQVIEPQ